MSVHTTATASVDAPPTGARGRWVLAVAASVAAPVLFVAGQALLPALPDDLAGAFTAMAADREQMLASRLLTAAGAFLFVPALLAVFALVQAGARGSRLLLAGGVVMGLGSFLNGLSHVVQGYVTHAATSEAVDPTAGVEVLGALGGLGAVALPIGFPSVIAFGIGMLLIGAALLVARVLPVWQPVLLVVAALLGFGTAGMGPIVALTMAPMAVAFASFGWTAMRTAQA